MSEYRNGKAARGFQGPCFMYPEFLSHYTNYCEMVETGVTLSLTIIAGAGTIPCNDLYGVGPPKWGLTIIAGVGDYSL